MKPILQALVLADHAYEDKASGKKIISGTFSRIILKKVALTAKTPDGGEVQVLPTGNDPGCPWFYLSLTDLHADTTLQLQFVDVSVNEVRFKTDIRIQVNDRLATVEVIAPLPHVTKMFGSKAGTYSLDVTWNGEILGSQRIMVVDAG